MTLNARRVTCKNVGNVSFATVTNYDNSVITGLIALKLRIMRASKWQCVSTIGCCRTCARARLVSRSRERLNRLLANLVQRWGPVNRVACKSQLDLLCTCACVRCRFQISRTAGLIALKFGTYTHRDRLLGCRENQLEAPLHSSARAGHNLSLARLSPQKASHWY